jgi:lysophospholipase L1-like esterase
MHIVLLGDSIFDNAAYVRAGEPDVRQQLADLLGRGDRVTRLAVDGGMVAGTKKQLERLPRDATHLVISAGGNDMLGQISMLYARVNAVAEAVALLAGIAYQFETNYRDLLTAAQARQLPLTVCTIYNPNEPNETSRRVQSAALMIINDGIIRAAGTFGIPVIELRHVCTTPADYANPIEPSAAGGAKIAAAIHKTVTTHNFDRQQTAIYT